MSRIETLTPAQQAALLPFRQEWFRIGTSTERADRKKAEAAILAMRAEIGVKTKPVFVWCESPATSLVALHVLKSEAWKKYIATLPARLEGSLGENLRDSLGDSLWASLRASLGDSLWASLWASLGDSLRASLRDSLGDSLGASLGASLRDSLRDSLRASLRDSLWAIRNEIGWAWWGQHESYWIAFYLFCRDMVGVKYDAKRSRHLDMWRDVAQSCCWWWCFENYVVVSERPTVVSMNERERIHNAAGPAIAFADGWKVYAVNGVRVPERVVLEPEKLTAKEITDERNAEVRRVMLERFGEGRYLEESGAKCVHEDKFGRLYRVELEGDEPLTMVRVKNSTPEPDGTWKHYFLRVHPELRPLLGGQNMGNPQKMTARNAVASTFGLTGKEYAPAVET